MAVYKVPQDVEADDKLIGPFSFRQFVYLIIVAISGFVAYILAQIFIGLIIIPLPIMIFFGVLALPLRKDQPMEIYLAAVVRFFLKPKNRIWKSEGTLNLVEVVAPHVVEEQRFKNISQDDAQNRFDYLARVMDSRGWSTRGVMSSNESVTDVAVAESTQMNDILDESNSFAQHLDDRLEEQEAKRRQETVERMHDVQAQATAMPHFQPEPPVQPEHVFKPPAAKKDFSIPSKSSTPKTTGDSSNDDTPVFNPYPNSMHQRIIAPKGSTQPADDTASDDAAAQPTVVTEDTVTETVSPDILQLAHNSDLSISAIAHEAERLRRKEDSEEVVISLR